MRSARGASRPDWIIRISLFVIGTAMLMLSPDFSMSGDEPAQIRIGRDTYMFLCRALGLLPGEKEHIVLSHYGGLFGVISTNLAHWFPWWDEVHLRHFLIAITGFLTIWYAGRIARLLQGPAAQLICIWMLACSPRFFGASMNNSKDIPFALGMTMAAYYLLRLVKSAPVLRPGHLAGLFLGIAFAIGIRIGGLMFNIYLLAAWAWIAWRYRNENRRYVLRFSLAAGGMSVLAFCAGIVFMPIAYYNLPLMTYRALNAFSNYRLAVTMLYRGQDIPTWEAPWHYLPVWIGITVPLVVILLFLASPVLRPGKIRVTWVLLLLMVLFPPLFAIVKGSPVYDGWRQFYFIYPPLAAIAAVAGADLLELVRSTGLRLLFGAFIALNLLQPLSWMVLNHPLENVYFNPLAGGINGAAGFYETDYYGEASETACRKLLQQRAFRKPLRDSVYVLNNIPPQINHYLKGYDPMIAIRHTAYEWRDSFRWDYAIFFTRGMDSIRKRTDWPPAGMIDSVMADRTLIMAVVKNPRKP